MIRSRYSDDAVLDRPVRSRQDDAAVCWTLSRPTGRAGDEADDCVVVDSLRVEGE